MNNARRPPRFCPQCGTLLPEGNPRFCIECGYALGPVLAGSSAPSSAGRLTVRLPNARVEQSVIGGTIKLPSSGAIPPGMWVLPEPPSAQTIVAIYAPLRAVVGGWSGLSGQGWRRSDRQAVDGSRIAFTFLAERVWFPAPGCGGGLQLHVTIAATAVSSEGEERLGFRYREGDDPPIQVVHAEWRTDDGTPVGAQPIPAIQIMAPPRIPRVSDLPERIRRVSRSEADRWSAGSATHGVYQLIGGDVQQRTPAGRGLILIEVAETRQRTWLQRLLSPGPSLYRARIERPFVVDFHSWQSQIQQIRQEAAGLGLDVETDAAIEWWLDRYGYDGAIFTGAQQRYQCDRVLIAFRRGQLVQI
ncbi:zinc ribbon domain-containing protein [Chloroflexus sp.]|uniref:zinc ribbon domain-containing protein n=1 Tax=Chloroflexus sp. TaxID=1904827 RepID=UPI002630F5DB|nr:zinc ribbon domain-containing protein [uncultured Chloroflexus sp.]